MNGNLSVSRAIGDPADKAFVISDADVTCFDLDGTEDYLVLACDGIWDVMDGKMVQECVHKHLGGGGSKQTVAQAIIDQSRSEGSSDNMTVIVLFFPGFTPPAPQQSETAAKEQDSSPPVDAGNGEIIENTST